MNIKVSRLPAFLAIAAFGISIGWAADTPDHVMMTPKNLKWSSVASLPGAQTNARSRISSSDSRRPVTFQMTSHRVAKRT